MEQFHPQDVRYNFRMGVWNGLFYIFAETLLDPTLVLVAFLSHLTDSPLLLGLVIPIRDGAWFLPQLWVSSFLQSYSKKLSFYRTMGYLRIASWVVIALTMNLVREPALLLVLFFIAFSVSSFVNGLAGLPFVEVVAKTIPPDRRGEFFAWRFGLGGLMSVGGSAVVRWLIDPNGPLVFPYNFGVLSVAFLVAATVSVFFFNSLREPAAPTLPRKSFSAQIRRAMDVLRQDHRYRQFLSLQSTLFFAATATPFFAVFVQQKLVGSPAMTGIYLAVLTLMSLVANAFFGRQSRRRGNAFVMVSAISAGILMVSLVVLLALLAEPLKISPTVADYWLVPVFILSGVRNAAIGVYGNSLLLEIAPVEERSLYVGFTNTFLGVVMLLTGFSGFVVAGLGYLALFVMALLAHALALAAGLQLIRASRSRAENHGGGLVMRVGREES